MDHVQDDLGRVIDWATPEEPVVLAGLSFGGLASLHYALRHPDRVRALVLIATGPGFKKAEAQAGWEAQVGRVAKRLDESGFAGWTEGAAAAMAIGARPELPAARAAGEAILAQNPRTVAHFGRQIAGPAPGVVDDLPQIAHPTLILVGERDKAFLRAGEVMAARLPDARHHVIPEAGHCLNLEQPDRFHELLLDFLGELP
jgi:pimeloyl-ACP methyl ester carboxylesterase